MSWLDAYDAYVMEVIARDRVDDLCCTADVATEPIARTSPPADAPTATPDASAARPVLASCGLAKVWR